MADSGPYAALRRALFLVPPERIHTVVFAGLRAATRPPALRRRAEHLLSPDPALDSTVFGVRFPGPLGLAAGFDKDGRGLDTWGALGFGYAEVGTVTAQAQPGNPEPRLFRLPDDRALLRQHPIFLAQHLFEHFARDNDDATVLVTDFEASA